METEVLVRKSNPESAEPTDCGNETGLAVQELSVAELQNPESCLSLLQARPFAGTTEFASEAALSQALAAAQATMPAATSAYKPTGKTTVSALVLMALSSPVVLTLLVVLCGGICTGFAFLDSWIHSTFGPSSSRLSGALCLGVDLGLVVLMVVVPMWSFGLLSKWCKNRNPLIPAILTGVIDFLAAIALFFPLWKGETLAPTHLTYMFIPVRWVLIVVGTALVPFIGAFFAHGHVKSQKFCEETGHPLGRVSPIRAGVKR